MQVRDVCGLCATTCVLDSPGLRASHPRALVVPPLFHISARSKPRGRSRPSPVLLEPGPAEPYAPGTWGPSPRTTCWPETARSGGSVVHHLKNTLAEVASRIVELRDERGAAASQPRAALPHLRTRPD